MKRDNKYLKKRFKSRLRLVLTALTILAVPTACFLAYNNTFNNKSKERATQVNKSNIEPKVQETVVKPQETVKTVYDERLDVPDGKNKFGALVESANKYGYSSLKVYEILKKGCAEDKFPELDGEKVMFLTFDDGPSQNTLKILDILDKYDIKATFFVVGKQVDENPDILKKVYEKGHAIANHTHSHMLNMELETFKKEISWCNKSIKKVLGEDFETRTLRHPGGFCKKNSILDYVKKENTPLIDWNTLNGDADREPYVKNEENLFKHIIKEAKDYKTLVSLMHDADGKDVTVKVLPRTIEHFKDNGFKFKILI